jgi:hypothetical protein
MSRALSVVSPQLAELHERYDQAMANAEAAAGEAAAQQTMYWWSLWVIKRDKLYRAKGHLSEEKWLDNDLLSEAWAPSRATYKGVMTAICDWKALGANDEGVQRLLGNRKVAVEGDIRNWFVPDSDRVLRPEVRMMLAAKGETPLQALVRISELPSGQARAAAGEVVDREYFLIERGSLVTTRQHGLVEIVSFIVRNEHTRKGLLGKWKITLVSEPLEVEDTHQGNRWPTHLLAWLLSRFGLIWD